MSGLVLDVVFSRRIHYAFQQNGVPAVRSVRVTHRGDGVLRDLEVRVALDPGVSETWIGRLAELAPGGSHRFDPVELALRPERLAVQDERDVASLRVEVVAAADGVVRAIYQRPVELLAYREWPGRSTLPEILAAFVQPNGPGIAEVLGRVGELVGERTGSPSLDGYQSRDPARVRVQVEALHDALRERGIGYVSPPASFEDDGQKIRAASAVLDERLASCLDLAVLQAACLEQMGLRPWIFLVEGHAFAGAWLVADAAFEPVVTDPIWIRKRVELGEIVAFESTAVCAPGSAFEAATEAGRRRLYAGDAFREGLDVQVARRHGIRPLPQRALGVEASDPPSRHPASADGAVRIASATVGGGGPQESAPMAPVDPEQGVEPDPSPAEPADTADRIDRWKQKLLDLTLRNRLLNTVWTKKTLQVDVDDLSGFEDALSSGRWFRVLATPKNPADPRRRDPHEQALARSEYLAAELGAGRIRVRGAEDDVERRLVEIYRAARVSVEEGGANTLYLALGFLRWFEAPSSTVERIAPVLLLPVELQRVSVADGFRLRLADEDARINTTLLQKLQQEFDLDVRGCDELPEDEQGLDVRAILDRFRRMVVDVDRWEVLANVGVGFFSFTKYLMWLDLDERRDLLLENRLLAHMVNAPEGAFPQDGAFPDPEELDAAWAPGDITCPKDADSSQLSAVIAGANARSFILEGPPGTGKSQTITNLIAQCLGMGKRVLFVAEKRAALEVVQRRLDDVGLGAFCLEVHSNKARKRAVVEQLGRVLDEARSQEPADWERTARELEAARRELNDYVERIHRTRSCGVSVFEALAHLIQWRDVPRLDAAWPDWDAEAYLDARERAGEMAAHAAQLGDVAGHPWRLVRWTDWSPGSAEEARRRVEDHRRALERFAAATAAWSDALGIARVDDAEALDHVRAVAELLRAAPGLPSETLVQPAARVLDRVRSWCEVGRARDALRADLYDRWDPALLELQLGDLRRAFAKWGRRLGLFRWFALRGPRRDLAAVCRDQLPDHEALLADLEAAETLREHEDHLRSMGADARALLGPLWREGEADWSALEDALGWLESVRRRAVALTGGDTERALERMREWGGWAEDPGLHLSTTARVGAALAGFEATDVGFRAAALELVRLLDIDEDEWLGAPGAGWFAARHREVEAWQAAPEALRDWCAWRRARERACERGLRPLAEAFERRELPPDAAAPVVLQRSFLAARVEEWFDREEPLRAFRGVDHEARIERFRELDRRAIELSGEVVRARLLARVPSGGGGVLAGSESGILLRELKKQRRHMPVRQLFGRIPSLLPRLAPCMLMSPLSVAQYLATEERGFDVVVFDEASQIPVWDAVGSIGRGRDVVVVGDSKQLPPTNFFMQVEGGDEGGAVDEDFEELESVLDECAASGLQRMGLRWHYRSRHESLIAFSNHHYYENRLHTFPAPDAGDLGVELVPVDDGVYDRAQGRHNRREAERLVAELVRRLTDPELQRWSYGVVTFSVAQQQLIEDLLDRERRQRPELERFFGDGELLAHGEPVFVKNLENVQGDERDVMLFSVCYGPDQAGKVYMNFGPLNRDGGERRLNVAITRARRRLLVFSTLRADHIDLTRTRARGAEHLRAFLDYAARGMAAIAETVAVDPAAAAESPFERQVGEALEARGHLLARQVGCSGYRIDLAVRDPDVPGRFVLGIECDGRTYHSAATARDRDRTRQSVLEHLGWRLCRVWSTDWWLDPEGQVARIEAALAEAQAAWDQRDAAAAARERVVEPSADVRPDPVDPDPSADPDASGGSDIGDGEVEAPALDVKRAAQPQPLAEPYPAVDDAALGQSEDFFGDAAAAAIAARLGAIVAAEGPISVELLTRRLTSSWGIGRLSAKARERAIHWIAAAGWAPDGDGVVWPHGVDPASWRSFRPAGPASAPRDADDVPLAEVANAIHALLRQAVAVGAEDLLREAARQFGVRRLGRAVRERMEAGLARLEERGDCAVDGETVRLLDG